MVNPLDNAVRDLRYEAADRIVSYTHYDASTGAAKPTLDQRFSYDELGRLKNASMGHGHGQVQRAGIQAAHHRPLQP